MAEEICCRDEMFICRELGPFFLEVEIATVMIQTDNIDILQIFPCPIVAGEFTKVGVLCGDIISFTIGLVARNWFMQRSTCLNWQEIRMSRQGHFLMGADEYLDATHRLTVLGVDKIGVFAIHVEDILEHTKDKAWNREYLGK